MDAQLKRGFIEVCVLAALKKGEAYGYSLINELQPCVEISESTLYPILKRLEGAKCLSVRSVEYNGRLRKYYSIEEEGMERIREFMRDWEEIKRTYDFIKGEYEDGER